MKIDWYTKTVLTVIAVCLVILTLQQVNVVPRMVAAQSPTQSAVQGAADGNYELRPNYDGSINVRVIEMQTPYDGLPVSLQKVSTSDDLNVSVKNSYLYMKPY